MYSINSYEKRIKMWDISCLSNDESMKINQNDILEMVKVNKDIFNEFEIFMNIIFDSLKELIYNKNPNFNLNDEINKLSLNFREDENNPFDNYIEIYNNLKELLSLQPDKSNIKLKNFKINNSNLTIKEKTIENLEEKLNKNLECNYNLINNLKNELETNEYIEFKSTKAYEIIEKIKIDKFDYKYLDYFNNIINKLEDVLDIYNNDKIKNNKHTFNKEIYDKLRMSNDSQLIKNKNLKKTFNLIIQNKINNLFKPEKLDDEIYKLFYEINNNFILKTIGFITNLLKKIKSNDKNSAIINNYLKIMWNKKNKCYDLELIKNNIKDSTDLFKQIIENIS